MKWRNVKFKKERGHEYNVKKRKVHLEFFVLFGIKSAKDDSNVRIYSSDFC